MEILQKLTDMGFLSEVMRKEKDGLEVVKVRTSKGWTYQRFRTEEDVDSWAKYHKPEGE